MCQTWRDQGYRACAYDIKSDPQNDLSTRAGFKALLDMSLRLLGPWSLMMCGPPCSMFTFWTSSQHKRSKRRPEGNKKDRQTRLANIIAENLAALLLVLHHGDPAMFPMLIIEQPRGSWMYKLPCFASREGIIPMLGLSFIATFMGAFVALMNFKIRVIIILYFFPCVHCLFSTIIFDNMDLPLIKKDNMCHISGYVPGG